MTPTYLPLNTVLQEMGLTHHGQLGTRLARHPEIQPDAYWLTAGGVLRPLFLPETIARLAELEPVKA